MGREGTRDGCPRTCASPARAPVSVRAGWRRLLRRASASSDALGERRYRSAASCASGAVWRTSTRDRPDRLRQPPAAGGNVAASTRSTKSSSHCCRRSRKRRSVQRHAGVADVTGVGGMRGGAYCVAGRFAAAQPAQGLPALVIIR